jgi:hypothetical protein
MMQKKGDACIGKRNNEKGKDKRDEKNSESGQKGGK